MFEKGCLIKLTCDLFLSANTLHIKQDKQNDFALPIAYKILFLTFIKKYKMQYPCTVGIDVGGTHTVLGIVTEDGQILWKRKLITRDYPTPEAFVADLSTTLLEGKMETGQQNIIGVGIGAPNGNFYTGNVSLAANLPWKGTIPLAKMIASAFHLPATITNDANAGALGEIAYGAAKDMKNFALITLGTGLGSGLVANGELVYGHDGFAGEFGHTIAQRGGRPCGCGRKGCLETYVSATGIVTTAMEFLQQKKQLEKLPTDWLISVWKKKKQISARDITIAANAGDPTALSIFDFTAEILGQSLAELVAFFSPEAIIFFGGLAKAGDLLLCPAKEYMENNLLSIYKDKVKILTSALPDDDAALLGAASIAIKK